MRRAACSMRDPHSSHTWWRAGDEDARFCAGYGAIPPTEPAARLHVAIEQLQDGLYEHEENGQHDLGLAIQRAETAEEEMRAQEQRALAAEAEVNRLRVEIAERADYGGRIGNTGVVGSTWEQRGKWLIDTAMDYMDEVERVLNVPDATPDEMYHPIKNEPPERAFMRAFVRMLAITAPDDHAIGGYASTARMDTPYLLARLRTKARVAAREHEAAAEFKKLTHEALDRWRVPAEPEESMSLIPTGHRMVDRINWLAIQNARAQHELASYRAGTVPPL